MPKTIALSSLRLQSQQRADMENSSFVGPSEWNQNINNSWFELYDLLISAYGSEYYEKDPPQTINVVSGTSKYALASDHYKTFGLDYVVSSTEKYPLNRYRMRDRNKKNSALYMNRAFIPDVEYRLRGSNIIIIPTPTTTCTLEHLYAPVATSMSADGDTIDGVNGWEEYIIVDAAIKALLKEESDVSVLMARKSELKRRLEEMAADRDIGEAQQATDVTGYFNSNWNY